MQRGRVLLPLWSPRVSIGTRTLLRSAFCRDCCSCGRAGRRSKRHRSRRLLRGADGSCSRTSCLICCLCGRSSCRGCCLYRASCRGVFCTGSRMYTGYGTESRTVSDASASQASLFPPASTPQSRLRCASLMCGAGCPRFFPLAASSARSVCSSPHRTGAPPFPVPSCPVLRCPVLSRLSTLLPAAEAAMKKPRAYARGFRRISVFRGSCRKHPCGSSPRDPPVPVRCGNRHRRASRHK